MWEIPNSGSLQKIGQNERLAVPSTKWLSLTPERFPHHTRPTFTRRTLLRGQVPHTARNKRSAAACHFLPAILALFGKNFTRKCTDFWGYRVDCVAIAKKANTKQTSPKLYLKRACSACAAYFLCGFNVTIITTFVQTCEIYQFFSENHCKSTILTLKLQWLVIGLKEKFEIQDYDNSGYRLEAQQVWA